MAACCLTWVNWGGEGGLPRMDNPIFACLPEIYDLYDYLV